MDLGGIEVKDWIWSQIFMWNSQRIYKIFLIKQQAAKRLAMFLCTDFFIINFLDDYGIFVSISELMLIYTYC